jgi:hypothetical protein
MGFEHSFLSAILAGVVAPLLLHSAITLASRMAILAAMGWWSWMLYVPLDASSRHKLAIR